MKGSKEIIDALNEVLAGELVAINQYFLHAKMLQNWGYLTIAAHTRSESIDEMRHAEVIADRILFLDG
ncbi:MAG TPA: ferritin-like domain-containing protein, partial [Candidatus Nanopelagicales bacterium]|nr:ferritin-like domain-containing protein [Candidatus Nanopelagicales bacterium]